VAEPHLALVELHYGKLGGHWSDAPAALAESAVARGLPVVIVAPGRGAPDEMPGVATLTRPGARDAWAWTLLAASRAVAALARLGRRRTPSWTVPYQWELAERCLAEAAALRIAAGWARPAPAAAVILTAGETLHGTVAVLSRVPHVRIVHDVQVWEGPILSRVERLLARGRRRVRTVCTTAAVRSALVSAYPDLTPVVRTFSLLGGDTVTPSRESARAALGLAPDEPAAALVGGWWRYKDIGVVADAVELVTRRVHLMVAGQPLDDDLLARMRAAAGDRLHVLRGPLDRREIHRVYAAADATIVARRPGIGKESALVMDAVRYGVPLLLSEHDPALTALLGGRPWVRTFPAGDGAALAAALDALADSPLARPQAVDAEVLGMTSAQETLVALLALQAELEA